MPAAPLTTWPASTRPPPSPVPTMAATEECCAAASGPNRMWCAYRAAAFASLVYTTGRPSRSSRAARMLKPPQSGWPKLVAPREDSTPSALAGPGVSSPTART